MINVRVKNRAYRIRELLLAVIATVTSRSGKCNYSVEVRFYDEDSAEVILWHYLPKVGVYHEKDGYGVMITPSSTSAELNAEIIKMIHRMSKEA